MTDEREQPTVATDDPPDDPGDDLIARIAGRIAEHAGLEMPDWVLRARLRQRTGALGLQSAEAYAALVTSHSGAAELDQLLEALRVGETRFFRHAGHVAALSGALTEELRERRAGKRVNVWSAGCASGEEAYTLAVILGDLLPRPRFDVRVWATDLSARAVAFARAGRYPISTMDHVPERWRDRAFVPEPGHAAGSEGSAFVHVAESIARRVTFEQRNLLDSAPPGRFDLIWCRNVLIYFTPEARNRAIGNLVAALHEGGVLFVGYSENLRDIDTLAPERIGDTVVYRKKSPAVIGSSPAIARASSGSASVSAPVSASTSRSSPLSAARAGEAAPEVIRLTGSYDDRDRLASQLESALSGQHRRVIIDLDGAEFLGDEAASVLRRAQNTARASGIGFELRAARGGPQRWLRRHGLAPGLALPPAKVPAKAPRLLGADLPDPDQEGER